MTKITKTDDEWRKELTPEQFRILRQKGTGPARTRHPDWISLLPPCNAACPAGDRAANL